MTATRKKTSVAKAPDPTEQERLKQMTRGSIRPSLNAAVVMDSFSGNILGKPDMRELIDALAESINTVNGGDMAPVEAMLYGQAQALQTVFTSLARRAAQQEYLKQYETYMRIALKAQNQCRMTLETLATVKNPPIVYAKQANISQGPQQVNNGVPPTAPPRAQEIGKPQNELLEDNRHEPQRMVPGTQAAPARGDTEMEAVGAIHRTQDQERQSKGSGQ